MKGRPWSPRPDKLSAAGRLQILGEAQMGGFLLVGRGGTGGGYVPRSLVCPVNLCPGVQG